MVFGLRHQYKESILKLDDNRSLDHLKSKTKDGLE